MAQSQVETKSPCKSCEHEILAGFWFCTYCGAKTDDKLPESRLTLPTCPACFASDEFSRKFCTSCGAKMDRQTRATNMFQMSKRNGFNWRTQVNPRAHPMARTVYSLAPKPEVVARQNRISIILPALLGVAFGVVLAGYELTAESTELTKVLAKEACPGPGVVVFVQMKDLNRGLFQMLKRQPQHATVTLTRVDGPVTTTFTNQTDAFGMAVIRDKALTRGSYQVSILADGRQELRSDVTLDGENRPTILAPAPIELPRLAQSE